MLTFQVTLNALLTDDNFENLGFLEKENNLLNYDDDDDDDKGI